MLGEWTAPEFTVQWEAWASDRGRVPDNAVTVWASPSLESVQMENGHVVWHDTYEGGLGNSDLPYC